MKKTTSKLIDEASKRETKKERDIRIKKNVFNTRIDLRARTPIEHQIVEMANQINKMWRGRPIQDTLNMYLQIRTYRHDLWIEFINNNRTVKSEMGDVRVSEFLDEIKKIGFYPSCEIDSKTMNKTPDILTLDSTNTFAILGDVTVTTSVQSATNRKYVKYKKVENVLESCKLRVRHEDFIIRDDGGNVEQVVSSYITLGLIDPKRDDVSRAKEFSITCTKLMNDVARSCVDAREFVLRLSKIDNEESVNESPIIIEDKIKDMYPIEEMEPIQTEEEIIDMIKKETEKLFDEDFFEEDVDIALKMFDQIVENNRKKEFMAPKSTLKICDNSEEIEDYTSYALIKDYIDDIQSGNDDYGVSEYILDMLPNLRQLEVMEKCYHEDKRKMKEDKVNKVYGPYQYSMNRGSGNIRTMQLITHLAKGKKEKNIKKKPETVNPDNYDHSYNIIEKMIEKYGRVSSKPSFLNDSWDSANKFEKDNSRNVIDNYEFCKRTNGAQLGNALSGLYHRLTHIKTKLSMKDNVYVPPNGSFIAIIPKEHAPTSSRRCDIPFVFMTRFSKNNVANFDPLLGTENEYKVETNKYTYVVTKLFRLDINKIAHWDQAGYRIVASSTYLLSINANFECKKDRVVGLVTLLILDLHQKVSEYLDLLKYISYMPFSDVHKLSDLVLDKFDLLIKTNFDIWMFLSLKDFINRLSRIDDMNARKPKLQLFNNQMTRESLGVKMSMPSFIVPSSRHDKVETFIEEVVMLYMIRPKMLYGSQFMDKSIHSTVTWNNEYEEEIKKYDTWATNGMNPNVEERFPFESKYCFSRDAIIHAQRYYNRIMPISSKRVNRELVNSKLSQYMHNNCSLRGCVKLPEKRNNTNDIHTTSMASCLNYYKDKDYQDEDCKASAIAQASILGYHTQEYAQSEKEQRGGGRPISTPDIKTKAELMMVEKPESSIGKFAYNNIIVPGKNKLKEMSEAYKKLIADGASSGKKQIYQLTEDQSKFSENDNVNKYVPYITNNIYLTSEIRSLQLSVIDKIAKRNMLVHRIPKSVNDNPELSKHILPEGNGVKATIGWPQGMLNFISTSVHSIADIWITYAYNLAYPDNQVITNGLVHSDDSWVAVACDNREDFVKFSIFRMLAKKMFCLKVNIKKLWGSKYMGELVSNYNINGNVHLSVARNVANCFNNLKYMNWVMDVHSQISSLQQSYRNGADLGTITMLSTMLRQQIIQSYQVKGTQLELLEQLPIELGGYPSGSPFELAITGVQSHYNRLSDMVKFNSNCKPSIIILKALKVSVAYNVEEERCPEGADRRFIEVMRMNEKMRTEYKEMLKNEEKNKDDTIFKEFLIDKDDYISIDIPNKGEMFRCFKHIMPKTTKVRETIDLINSLPYLKTELNMLIRNPKDLETSLGNLKAGSSSLIYSLAADNYTQQARRMAVSQAIQSSGKIMRVSGFPPMTICQMLDFLANQNNGIMPMTPDTAIRAFQDDTNISCIAKAVVTRSTSSILGHDKRKIVNRQPEVENRFITVARLDNVLLRIIDKEYKTDLLTKYGKDVEHVDILDEAGAVIKSRFKSVFYYYNVKYSCNLIAQMAMSEKTTKLWMQPYCRTDTMRSFLEDLYGKTVSSEINYSIDVDISQEGIVTQEKNIVSTLYTTLVLNELYPDGFEPFLIMDNHVNEVIKELDYGSLSNEDYLKYAIVRKKLLNDDTHLREFNKKFDYNQYFSKPQEFNNETKRYEGNFVCKIRYGGTVMVISGVEEDVKIESTTNNITEILNGMMIFVNKNFRYYRYDHPNLWYNSKFWENKQWFSKTYLNAYNMSTTVISTSRHANSIPINITKNIKYDEEIYEHDIEGYTTDAFLRQVYRINKDGKQVKIASVRQDMSCPMAKDVELIETDINGISNTKLYRNRAILSITLKRYNTTSINEYVDLIKSKKDGLPGEYIANFWANLLRSLKVNLNEENIRRIEEYEEDQEVKEIINIEPKSATTFIVENEETTPEDLDFVKVEYMNSEGNDYGSMFVHSDITEILCQMITSSMGFNEFNDIILDMFKDSLFKKKIIDTVRMGGEEIDDFVTESFVAAEMLATTTSAYIYIRGKKLHRPESWDKIDIKQIFRRNETMSRHPMVSKYATDIKKNIMSVIYEKDNSTDEEDMLEIMEEIEKKNN